AASAEATRLAEVKYNETTGWLTPAKTYADEAADADRAYRDALAEAQRSLTVDGDLASYQAQIDEAVAGRDSRMFPAQETYLTTQAGANAQLYTDRATAEHTAAGRWIEAVAAKTKGQAAAYDGYDHQAGEDWVAISAARDTIDKSYAESSAASWKAALTAFVT